MSEELETAKPGVRFNVCVSTETSMDDLRRQVKQETGLDVHFECRVGPMTDQGGGRYTWPMEPVDQEFLSGGFAGALPGPGSCVYVGYFKEPDETSAAA